MTPAEQYRSLAAKLDAKARAETDVQLSAEWKHLAMNYLRLAQQADRNQAADVAYHPILRDRLEDAGDTA